MGIVKKYNPNKLFFSDRLVDKVSTVFEHDLTVIEAPTGFGKTTAMRNAISKVQEPYIWLTIENESLNDFYDEVCSHVQELDINAANHLRSLGIPADEDSMNKVISTVRDIDVDEMYTIVLDNYQFIENDRISDMIFQISSNSHMKFRIVLLTQTIKSGQILELVEESKINYIGKTDLEFNAVEIKQYFRTCGIKLEDEETDYLYRYTEGWISAVYLQMLQYISNSHFEPDAGIDQLVCNAIWDKLDTSEQDFLISISIYDSFSLKQAIHIGKDELDAGRIKNLLISNSFIRYDIKNRKYYAHAILRFFLKTEFEKLDRIYKKRVYKKAANWYNDNENYYMALKYYYNINDFDAIYSMNFSMNDLLPHFHKKNKQMFLDIISQTSVNAKEKNIRRSIILCFTLFIYNERDFFVHECEFLQELIYESEELKSFEKDTLIGELLFIKAFEKYNDLEKIKTGFEEAYEYLKSPSNILSDKLSLTFRNPSVIFCFHKDKGKIYEELEALEKMMLVYYKITLGNSKGLEALMRAEILFNQGNLEDAEILCQKALYMAETRNQINVYISTMFLMLRIAVYRGDYEAMKDIQKSIRNKIEQTGAIDESFTADLCDSYVYVTLEKNEDLSAWIKNENTIEEKCYVINLGFANIIYAKYLLLNEEYSKFLGISGQMLGVASVYNNIMYELYTYIYIAIANQKLGNYTKALKFVSEAIEIAQVDEFVMPFVENYHMLEEVFVADKLNEKYKKFLSKVNSLRKKYEKEYKNVQNSYRNDVNYGLTKRELQIAKLAAARYTNKEIADKLYIAESTVKSNLKTVFSKMQVKSRSELKNFFS